MEKDQWDLMRLNMVRYQIERRNVTDEKVLKAVEKVPRHLFVPENLLERAYSDGPMPIGDGQTISQPFIVAFMTEALKLNGDEKILEIGTGSGYQTAILAEIVKDIYTIEIVENLYHKTKKLLLEELKYQNIRCRFGDGYYGWPKAAPFDNILITASPKKLPLELINQLKVGGKLVVPVGSGWHQELKCITKTPSGTKEEFLLDVRFVPMTGEIERQ